MFVGPGMKTGFWNDMGAILPMISRHHIAQAPLPANFFEMFFPMAEKSLFPTRSVACIFHLAKRIFEIIFPSMWSASAKDQG
jgi:hypothetical protein